MTSKSRPDSVTGGCLCGAIRYTIHFPADAEWPPSHNATCQCTQCRKTTGSLLPQLLEIPLSHVTPDLTPTYDAAALPSYRLYRSSSRACRGFCTACGSSLTWIDAERPETIEVHVGTLDEEVLIGRLVESKEEERDEYGVRQKREGGWGRELGKARWHNFVENAVPGVTDRMEGPKHLRIGLEGEKSFGGGLEDVGRG
ncbi:Mss4-like protein [Macrophomina phaseolina]|uniref:Mss4-like protein n=1 Tax=Macrophomina phaseolina TaxID=35725 RepID=A0ABQ8G2T0_9PEZI|nr:Mss4-like protein [Macrophomina phaseolina]